MADMAGYLRTLDGREHHIGKASPPVECFHCGVCCVRYQPQLTTEESETIARGLKMSTENFLARYAQFTNVGYLLRHSERGCVFLSWEKDDSRAICTIYPFRPEACRNWVASLSRPECQEGLVRLKNKSKIMLATELYPSQEEVARFYEQLSTNTDKKARR